MYNAVYSLTRTAAYSESKQRRRSQVQAILLLVTGGPLFDGSQHRQRAQCLQGGCHASLSVLHCTAPAVLVTTHARSM